MFGYVVLSDSVLASQKDTYREYYCGLCHVLGEKYGATGRRNLSYDFTFLSMLLSDLYDETRERGTERCSVHPMKSHAYSLTKGMDYASDMQMLLSYYSILDGIRDEGLSERKLKAYGPAIRELEARYPRQFNAAKENLGAIGDEEKSGRKDAEYNALLFGRILGEVFVRDEKDFFAPDLNALGVGLGRFIYLLDAWDDRKRDERKGAYNPLPENISEEEMEKMLLDAASTAASAFERLPLDEHLPILRNIIYSGIWTRFKAGKK